MKTTKTILVCMLAAVFGLTSCTKESINPYNGEGEDIEMTITTNVLGIAESQARALMTNVQETAISEVRVIAFNTTHQYLYTANGRVENMTQGSGNTSAAHGNNGLATADIKFTAKKSAANVYFVVIANANTQVDAVVPEGTASSSTTKAAIYSNTNMRRVMGSKTTKWTATTIPMIGETANAGQQINDATPKIAVNLQRMLARIDVNMGTLIAPTPAGGSFELKSVSLYDYNNGGHIAPGQTLLQGAGAFGATTTWAVPRGTTPYSDHMTYNATGGTLTREIYTFERTIGAAGTANPTTLVIGGVFKSTAHTNPTNAVSYYKLELKDGSGNLPINRNHSYNVTITSVNGPGFPTEPPVFDTQTVTLGATIVQWTNKPITGSLEGPL